MSLEVGDLVNFYVPVYFWDDTEYTKEEEEYYGVGLIIEKGPEYSLIPEYLVMWTKIGTTTWEWGEFLQKVQDKSDIRRTKEILDSEEEK